MKETLGIVLTIVGITSAAISLISVVTLIKHRTDTLKEGENRLTADLQQTTRDLQTKIDAVFMRVSDLITRIENSFKEDIRRAMAELNTATTLTKEMQIGQQLVNKFTSDTLESITTKQEKMEDRVNNLAERIRVLESD